MQSAEPFCTVTPISVNPADATSTVKAAPIPFASTNVVAGPEPVIVIWVLAPTFRSPTPAPPERGMVSV
jgi:hypothetical protein